MYRDMLLELLENGALDPMFVADALIRWISEDDCEDFVRIYEVKPIDDDEG